MRKNRGFTLIEILVVIAIISAIIGGVSLMIAAAMRAKTRSVGVQRVTSLGAAIDQLESSDKLGAYPPTRIERLTAPGAGGNVGKQLGKGNDVNCGIETVYVALRLKGIKVAVDGFDTDESVGNLDDDKAAAAVPDMPDARLFEYLDPWGNPLVYIQSNDYKDMKGVEQYMLTGNRQVKVQPKTLANGEFVRADKFQLFSCGEDEIPGTDDDIHYGVQ